MEIRLSDSFTYKKLIRYVLPCIAMMIMTSIYSIVDGYFVSNIIGKNPFAAVNLVMPVLMAISAIGFMIGTGGSALTSYYMRLGEKKKANEVFSMLVWLIIISSCIVAVIGFVFMPQIVELLGASDTIRSDAILYGRILILSEPFFMLQNSFQSFLTTAEKQNLGLLVSVLAGITNMVLDFLLMFVFRLGIAGAAAATVCRQIIGSVVPLIYFATNTTGSLKLTKAKFDWKCIWKACGNGSSEMLTNLSTSLVSVVYNLQLMKLANENGIAAYGVIMYVSFIFMAIFFGYAIGVTPIIGYNYGAGNKKQLHSLLKKSLVITAVTAITMTVLSEVLALPIARIFVGYDDTLCRMTQTGMMLFSISFLFCGFNVFGSGFFTGLGNGLVSATISFLRTLVIQLAAVLMLPMVFGINGIWCAVAVAEAVTLVITITFLIKNKKKYGY